MQQLYARVFLQILDSSIAENYELRHIFEDFLKLASRDGAVDMTRESISRRLNVPLEKLNDAISHLMAPDLQSRDAEHEGRRLAYLDDHRDWGWKILNWEKYDKIRTKLDVAIRVARHRENKTFKKAIPLPSDANPIGMSTAVPATKLSEEDHYHPNSRTVLHMLREVSGKHYREVDSNLSVISARLKEPEVDLEGVKAMITHQFQKWKGTKDEFYMRPETLFGKQKFDGYYATRNDKIVNTVTRNVDSNQLQEYIEVRTLCPKPSNEPQPE